jgi:hypothetical protein
MSLKGAGLSPRLFIRQRHLLALLEALGGRATNTDFQKLLFLYCMERDGETLYDFVPYNYGAFSFTSYADRKKLNLAGLTSEDDDGWRMTREGREVVTKFRDEMESAMAFAGRHIARGKRLIEITYKTNPYYATRSKIASDVLANDCHALGLIEASKPQATIQGLATIGYEGRTLEKYLNILIQDGVSVLCDVRLNPISRKYGFSKKVLSYACTNLGIRYEHVSGLGIDSAKRKFLVSRADYAELFDEYDRIQLPRRTEELRKIANWISQGERVALTCYEHSACDCHRGRVANALRECNGKTFEAVHL